LGLELCCARGSLFGWHCCGICCVGVFLVVRSVVCFCSLKVAWLLFRVQLTFGPRVINRAE
jgi:hypothetical protein